MRLLPRSCHNTLSPNTFISGQGTGIRLLAAVACAFGLACWLQPVGNATPRIIGGGDADQSYPFVVSVQAQSNEHFCGGSLINRTWVLTAAHCVHGKEPTTTKVRIGSNDRTHGGEESKIAEIVVHPDYDPAGAGGDIALLRLSTPAKAAPITIGKQPYQGSTTRILGWGQTCATSGCGEAPPALQQLDTSVLAGTACTADFNGDVELCIDNPGGSGSCYGDSGGPAVAMVNGQWQLLGVTSRSGNNDKTCATAPSIYTSAPAYARWIEDETVAQTPATAGQPVNG